MVSRWHSCSAVVCIFWLLHCDGISSEGCPINGSKPTWMLWWKRETCNLQGRDRAREMAFLFVHCTDLDPLHPRSLYPAAFTGLLLSEFPRCGQSTDVCLKQTVSFPTKPPTLSADIPSWAQNMADSSATAKVLFANEVCVELTLRKWFVLQLKSQTRTFRWRLRLQKVLFQKFMTHWSFSSVVHICQLRNVIVLNLKGIIHHVGG